MGNVQFMSLLLEVDHKICELQSYMELMKVSELTVIRNCCSCFNPTLMQLQGFKHAESLS